MSDFARPGLVRAVGLFSLTAMTVNGIVGAGIFVLPAQVSGLLGPAALSAYVMAGLAVGLIVLCFAEVGSLFDRSGGPYLYARTAFGDWIGFEVGWMLLLSRLTAVGAISNAFAGYLGFFWPAAAAGTGRAIVISVVIGGISAINYFGVRYGARVSDVLTISKLAPLLVFVAAGLFWIDPARALVWALPPASVLPQASLLLIFAFGGFEMAVVAGDEIVNPRRNLPIALLTGVSTATLLYLLIQAVAQGALPDLESSATPLASAAVQFLGPFGGVLLTAGAVLSTTGTNSATLLMAPRIVYGMAEGRQLPAIFAGVHPRYRTPHVAIIAIGLLSWAFAIFSGFAALAALSAIARLLTYMATCAALPVLRRKMPEAARGFTVPGGAAIPAAALAVSVWLLAGMTKEQFAVSGGALAAGAILHAARRRYNRLIKLAA